MAKKKGFNLEAQIIKHLRQISRIYPLKREALKQAKRGKDAYECNVCKAHFHPRMVQVDHTDPVGGYRGSWDTYIQRMFCGIENLKVLCLGCHKEKTLREGQERKIQRSL